MANHDALYYPFSRCLDATLLKQLLLIFDSITFVDPVDDDIWRSQLIRDKEPEHDGYRGYRDIAACIPWLRAENVVRVKSPEDLLSTNSALTSAATLSDLADNRWSSAADPRRYALPTEIDRQTGRPSWQIFQPKIPAAVIDALMSEPAYQRHLLYEGDYETAWELSYAAGSAIGINVHFAAAQELGLAPVTDSRLHHELMLMKLARPGFDESRSLDMEAYADQIGHRVNVRLINEILPKEKMDILSLEDILRFRDETTTLRQQFIYEVRNSVIAEVDPAHPSGVVAAEQRVMSKLLHEAKIYGDEICAIRDRLWPKILDSMSAPLPAGATIAGLSAACIVSSGHVLAASLILTALQPLKTALEYRADLKKIQRSPSAPISYLSQLRSIVR